MSSQNSKFIFFIMQLWLLVCHLIKIITAHNKKKRLFGQKPLLSLDFATFCYTIATHIHEASSNRPSSV